MSHSATVWLEEHEVNGQKVLVPVLYVCDATRTGIGVPRGAVLAGSELVIETGTLRNSGAIRGSDSLYVSIGSNLAADADGSGAGDLRLSASGDISVTHATENYYSMRFKAKRGFLSYSSKLTEEGGTRAVGSYLSGHNVSLHAGDNVLVMGSGIAAANDLGLKADTGDVIVGAAQDTHWTHTKTQKSKVNIGKLLASGFVGGLLHSMPELSPLAPFTPQILTQSGLNTFYEASRESSRTAATYNVGSVLSAGNNLSVEAGRDVSLIGSAAVAGSDLLLSAGRDVNIIPGRESSFSQTSKTKTEVGFWSSLTEQGLTDTYGIRTEERSATRTGDYTAGSLVSAGRDVLF